jgi:hypothetical protein
MSYEIEWIRAKKNHVLEFKINLISIFCHQIAKRKEKEALEAELQAAIKEKEAQVRNKTINKQRKQIQKLLVEI